MTILCPAFPRLAVMVVFLALAAQAAAGPAPERKAAGKGTFWVFIGTYTGPKSKGIYRLELDPATGKLSEAEVAAETASPSFLAIAPGGKNLYAVGETADFGGKMTGSLVAFSLDVKTGSLKMLNRQSSGGAGPCHLVTDARGKHVLAANYGGGSACVVAIKEDGSLGEQTAFVQHKGSSVNPGRQEGPHAHSINLDAANRFTVVADLGLDKVLIYRYDPAKGTLEANDPPAAAVAPGAGPRHFAFHPDGKHAYVINEMANTITVMNYDSAKGVLEPVQTVTTLPKDFKGVSHTAEVQVHPSGKFVYGSNRGHNSIAVFTVEDGTGKLTPAGHQAMGIKTPRNFGIDPTGGFMIVANQDGDSLIVFRIDPRTGALEPTGQTVRVPAPVCVKFLPRAP